MGLCLSLLSTDILHGTIPNSESRVLLIQPFNLCDSAKLKAVELFVLYERIITYQQPAEALVLFQDTVPRVAASQDVPASLPSAPAPPADLSIPATPMPAVVTPVPCPLRATLLPNATTLTR
ncbi:hypothetical protein D9613_008831 [Agrocybe pediades]|uniref:Uncharacterized protein n=1 Tax=Agrocybe pediades TaxID=84607 RepID=A0A8H4QUQ7_9AGAR|nr:hypothetical protein D9613_008831 [Agrocybe pediades]